MEIIVAGCKVEKVQKFRYLGLEVDNGVTARAMMTKTLDSARRAFKTLVDTITVKGWDVRATRLILLDVMVRSVLTFGCNVWASAAPEWVSYPETSLFKAFEVFYRRALRRLAEVDRTVRNEVLYIVTARVPLALFILK